MQRNNFSLIKAFASKWPTLPPPPDALLPHITAGGPQAVSGAKGRLSRPFADRRMFGLRLASAGAQRPASGSSNSLHMNFKTSIQASKQLGKNAGWISCRLPLHVT